MGTHPGVCASDVVLHNALPSNPITSIAGTTPSRSLVRLVIVVAPPPGVHAERPRVPKQEPCPDRCARNVSVVGTPAAPGSGAGPNTKGRRDSVPREAAALQHSRGIP